MSDGLLPFSGNGGLGPEFQEPPANAPAAITDGAGEELAWGEIADGEIVVRDGTEMITTPFENGYPWFKWNRTDLSQFADPVNGSHVASAVWSVVSWLGVNWIQGTVTNTVAAGHNGANTCSVLALSGDAPSYNNIVVADFVAWVTNGSLVGACVFGRFTSTSDAVWTRFQSSNLAPYTPHHIGKFTAGELLSLIGEPQADPNTLTDGVNGIRLGLGVEGDMLVTALFGERQIIGDGSGDVSVTGKPGIGIAIGDGAGVSNTIRFRNIRCYTVPDEGVSGL